MENQDKKRELIIETAVKRFAHFGLAKTTMTEIAADLSISKALLYYYFPDKLSLYAAVLKNIVKDMESDYLEGIKKINKSEDALFFYLGKRHEYILKFYNILEFIRTSGPDLPASILAILQDARTSEHKIISSIIQTGIDSKEFKVTDASHVAAILIDALTGMRVIVLHNRQTFQLQKQEFEELLHRQKQLGEIFLNGLKYPSSI